MMKYLYFIIFTTFFSDLAIAQSSWNRTDEPSPGDSTAYILMDSLTDNLAHVKGANVTWDYSGILAYPNTNLRKGRANAISKSVYAGFFTNADYDGYIDGHVHDFYNLNSTEKHSYGNQVSEDKQGDFLIVYNQKKTKTYPWTYNSQITGNLTNANVVIDPGTGSPSSYPAVGTYKVVCDGYGDLKIGDSVITGVIRNFVYDSVVATVIIAHITLVSNQYEYYKVGNPFPFFIHSSFKVYGATLDINYNLVLSQAIPHRYMGIDEAETGEVIMTISPNPTRSGINLSASRNINLKEMKLFDNVGRLQMTGKNAGWGKQFAWETGGLRSGKYILQLITDDGVVSKQLIILP